MNKELKHDLTHEAKPITFHLDKERNFVLDLNAYAEIDLLYEDKSSQQVETDMLRMRPYAIRAFLWGGLVHEDRELKIEHISKFVTIKNVQDIVSKLYEAVLDSKPEFSEKQSEQQETGESEE